MIDCHNHLQDERLSDSIEQIVIELRSRGVKHWVGEWDVSTGLGKGCWPG